MIETMMRLKAVLGLAGNVALSISAGELAQAIPTISHETRIPLGIACTVGVFAILSAIKVTNMFTKVFVKLTENADETKMARQEIASLRKQIDSLLCVRDPDYLRDLYRKVVRSEHQQRGR